MPQESKKQPNKFLKYSGLGFQMGATIAVFALAGDYFDSKRSAQVPVFTIILSLLGVGIAMYLVIKEVKNSAEE